MATKQTGLSRELIIHPGETLQEIMELRGMSQAELASRACVSAKHVSTVLNGQKPISVSFAKKLEYVLGVEASFWINLQSEYDRELTEYEEINNISADEISVLSNLKEVITFLEQSRIIETVNSLPDKVLELRRFLNIGNLTCIPNVSFSGAFRISHAHNIDAYVLFAWMQLCDYYANRVIVESELDLRKLKESLPEVKKLIGEHPDLIMNKLQRIFAQCGIAFNIVKNFKGAPVHGLIKKRVDGRISLSVTIRKSFADIFWFAVYHEIAHVLNGDFNNRPMIDFSDVENECEEKANSFACNALLDKAAYSQFLCKDDFSISAIRNFAEEQQVPPFVVIGRLQKEERIPYGQLYEGEKVRYKWAESPAL